MKVLKYQDISELHDDQRKLIANNYDDWNLVTGRVGNGKSKWARKNARKLDPTFGLERIHFDETPFWKQYVSLRPGQAIILDEFKGHRRAAMHGERIDLLEKIKRVRSRFLHVFVVYDRVSTLDRDLLTDRNAYWHHLEQKGNAQVRQPSTKLRFKMDSTPIEPTSYPLVGDFPFTPWEPPGFEEAYERKKHAEQDVLGDAPRKVEEEPAPVPPAPKSHGRIDMILADMAQRELAGLKPLR